MRTFWVVIASAKNVCQKWKETRTTDTTKIASNCYVINNKEKRYYQEVGDSFENIIGLQQRGYLLGCRKSN